MGNKNRAAKENKTHKGKVEKKTWWSGRFGKEETHFLGRWFKGK